MVKPDRSLRSMVKRVQAQLYHSHSAYSLARLRRFAIDLEGRRYGTFPEGGGWSIPAARASMRLTQNARSGGQACNG